MKTKSHGQRGTEKDFLFCERGQPKTTAALFFLSDDAPPIVRLKKKFYRGTVRGAHDQTEFFFAYSEGLKAANSGNDSTNVRNKAGPANVGAPCTSHWNNGMKSFSREKIIIKKSC